MSSFSPRNSTNSADSENSSNSTNSRHALLLKQFNKSIFKKHILTDIEIEVDGHVYKAHRLVLSCFSHYLERQLLKIKGRGPYRITIPNVGREAIEILLRYMYTGKLNLTCENFFEVYKAASVLEMMEVMEHCIQLLEPKEGIKSCFYSLVAAKKLENDIAYSNSLKHLAHRFEETVISREYLDLDVTSVIELISSQTIGTRSYITAKFLGQESLFRQYELPKRNFLFDDLPMDLWYDHQHSDGSNSTPRTHRNNSQNNSLDRNNAAHTADCSHFKKEASHNYGEAIFSENHPLQTCTEFIRSAKKRYSNVIPAEKESFEKAEILNDFYDCRMLRNQEIYRREVVKIPLKACGPEAIHIEMVNEETYAKNQGLEHPPIPHNKKGKLSHPQTVSPEITPFMSGNRQIHQGKLEHFKDQGFHKTSPIGYDKHKRTHQKKICPSSEINIEPVHSVATKDDSIFRKVLPRSSTFDSLNINRTSYLSRPEMFANRERTPISTIENKSRRPDDGFEIDSMQSLPEKERVAKSTTSLDHKLRSQGSKSEAKVRSPINSMDEKANRYDIGLEIESSESSSENESSIQNTIPLDQYLKTKESKTGLKKKISKPIDDDQVKFDGEYFVYELKPPHEDVTMDDQLKKVEVVESVMGTEVLPKYTQQIKQLPNLRDLKNRLSEILSSNQK